MIDRPSIVTQALAQGCYSKSREGLWARALFQDGAVVVSFLVRHKVVNGVIHVLDANGDDERLINPRNIRSWQGWREAGRVSMDRPELFEFCQPDEISLVVAGIMRHTVKLITNGWGDSPEDVVDWFQDLTEGRFIVPGNYTVVDPIGPFEGLRGAVVELKEGEDGGVSGELVVDGVDRHQLDVDDVEPLYYLIALEPST